jgi:hypothetical protein
MAFDGVTHSQVPPALLSEKAAGGSWLWITPGSWGMSTGGKKQKTAPGCNLIFRKNCLDKWVHLTLWPKGVYPKIAFVDV